MDIVSAKEAKLREVDKSGKMGVIISLCDASKWREAIAYTYHIYSGLINEKYSVSRTKFETLREFAIKCVTKYGQDPLRVYPYVGLVESVIYGNLNVDKTTFQKAMTLFGRIFQDLTGSIFTFKVLSNDDENTNALDTLEIIVDSVDSDNSNNKNVTTKKSKFKRKK